MGHKVVSIMDSSPYRLIQKINNASNYNPDMIEVRLDGLEEGHIETIGEIDKNGIDTPLIITVMPFGEIPEVGFKGSAEERAYIMKAALDIKGFEFVSLEYSRLVRSSDKEKEIFRNIVDYAYKKGKKTIGTHHIFGDSIPCNGILYNILDRLKMCSIRKLACTINSPNDLKEILKFSSEDVAIIPMGGKDLTQKEAELARYIACELSHHGYFHTGEPTGLGQMHISNARYLDESGSGEGILKIYEMKGFEKALEIYSKLDFPI